MKPDELRLHDYSETVHCILRLVGGVLSGGVKCLFVLLSGGFRWLLTSLSGGGGCLFVLLSGGVGILFSVFVSLLLQDNPKFLDFEVEGKTVLEMEFRNGHRFLIESE